MNGVAPPSRSRRRIVAASVTAFVAAAVAVVAFVLPAEHGIDPLGSGAALGLLALAEPERHALQPAAAGYTENVVAFELQPFESVEYKYRLEAGVVMLFEWRASGDVVAELHAEPDGAPAGYAESFDRRRAATAAGSYQAPFGGWHGWFWENRGAEPVSVRLRGAGSFSAARTYRGGHVWEEALGTSGSRPQAAPTGAGESL